MSVIWSWTYFYNLYWNNYLYFKGLLYIWEEMIMLALLHMAGLKNSECIWKIQQICSKYSYVVLHSNKRILLATKRETIIICIFLFYNNKDEQWQLTKTHPLQTIIKTCIYYASPYVCSSIQLFNAISFNHIGPFKSWRQWYLLS
jgi:hypothetical protein